MCLCISGDCLNFHHFARKVVFLHLCTFNCQKQDYVLSMLIVFIYLNITYSSAWTSACLSTVCLHAHLYENLHVFIQEHPQIHLKEHLLVHLHACVLKWHRGSILVLISFLYRYGGMHSGQCSTCWVSASGLLLSYQVIIVSTTTAFCEFPCGCHWHFLFGWHKWNDSKSVP